MSDKHQHIICPNCGYHTTENYCARCGQENHLHKETFVGLIMHFVGHYFHYDSKLWQTLKALWFRPGKLTTAYWNMQRMRYIPPISLYIFISIVFFLIYSSLPLSSAIIFKEAQSDKVDSVLVQSRSAGNTTEVKELISNVRGKDGKIDDKSNVDEIKDKAIHMLPKVFFFLIPVMGFLLQLLFIKRKDLTYVNHVIFALHYHTFWFSLMLLNILYRFERGSSLVGLLAFLCVAFYFIVALRNVYGITWVRSLAYSFIVAVVYLIFLAICVLGMVALLTYLYGSGHSISISN